MGIGISGQGLPLLFYYGNIKSGVLTRFYFAHAIGQAHLGISRGLVRGMRILGPFGSKFCFKSFQRFGPMWRAEWAAGILVIGWDSGS